MNYAKPKRIYRLAKNLGGFTIVEVMIVLAVSGLIFLSAAMMISGRQNRTGFTTSINDTQAQLQQVINDVLNGYYPNANNFTCQQGAGANPPNVTSGANSQGTNAQLNSGNNLSGCMFLGKAVQLAVSQNGSDNDTTSPLLYIYPVIGNLAASSGLPAQKISDSNPILLAKANNSPATFPNIMPEQYTLKYGLVVKGMCYSTSTTPCNPAAIHNTAVIAFASSPTVNSNGPTLASGTQQVNIVAVPNTSLGLTSGKAVADVNANLKTAPVNPAGGIEVCIGDDSTDESGLLTIGGSGSEPSVTLNVKDGSNDCT